MVRAIAEEMVSLLAVTVVDQKDFRLWDIVLLVKKALINGRIVIMIIIHKVNIYV